MAHALVRVMDCRARFAIDAPAGMCGFDADPEWVHPCDGCLYDGRRIDASSAVPIKPVPGGGCRGDEWRTMKSWERD